MTDQPTIASVAFDIMDAEAAAHAAGPLDWGAWHDLYHWDQDTDDHGRRLERSFTLLDGYETSRPAGMFTAESLCSEPFRVVWATDSKSVLAAADLWLIVTYCEGDLTVLHCKDSVDFHAAYDAAAAYYRRFV